MLLQLLKIAIALIAIFIGASIGTAVLVSLSTNARYERFSRKRAGAREFRRRRVHIVRNLAMYPYWYATARLLIKSRRRTPKNLDWLVAELMSMVERQEQEDDSVLYCEVDETDADVERLLTAEEARYRARHHAVDERLKSIPHPPDPNQVRLGELLGEPIKRFQFNLLYPPHAHLFFTVLKHEMMQPDPLDAAFYQEYRELPTMVGVADQELYLAHGITLYPTWWREPVAFVRYWYRQLYYGTQGVTSLPTD